MPFYDSFSKSPKKPILCEAVGNVTCSRRHTVKKSGFCCAVLGIVVVVVTLGYVHPIAVPELVPHPHARDPDRTAVTFVTLGDMGTGGSAQTQVAHAMDRVCQRDGCDFVLGLGDNIYPHSVTSTHDPQFQDKFEHPYARFRGIDFWMILGNHDWKHLVPGAQAKIDYTLHSERWRLPHTHYAIPFLPPWLHLYGVDTSLLEAGVGVYQVPAAQAALCGQPGWRILFGHYPTHAHWFVMRALEYLIRQCRIQVYFAGHDHRLCRKIAFSRQNPKIVYWKIKNLRVQTFLFSVICDRAGGAPGVRSHRHRATMLFKLPTHRRTSSFPTLLQCMEQCFCIN